MHPQTIARWLGEYNIATVRPGGRLRGVTVAELVDRYQSSDLTVAELARQVGLRRDCVVGELRAAGIEIDRSRRPPPRRLSAEERQWAVQRYVADEWPLRRLADQLDRSVYSVRAELVAAGVPIVHRGGVSRQDRAEVPPEQVERLYVIDGLTAEQSGDTLGVAGDLVLRTGHSYGLPIRPGGAAPLVPADVRLIEDLYADDGVSTVLDRHRLPRRAPIWGIAIRFPQPVPLTQDLVRDLYEEAGCSSTHIELLTGQSAATVRKKMAEWGIRFARGAYLALLEADTGRPAPAVASGGCRAPPADPVDPAAGPRVRMQPDHHPTVVDRGGRHAPRPRPMGARRTTPATAQARPEPSVENRQATSRAFSHMTTDGGDREARIAA